MDTATQIAQTVQDTAWSLVAAQMRRTPVDTVHITLPADMQAMPDTRNPILARLTGGAPLSLVELEGIFRRLGRDPRIARVVLHMRDLNLGLADLQTLRSMIGRLRGHGKQVITFAPGYDLRTYFVASAADTIALLHGGSLVTLGLFSEQVYLKDGLAAVGVTVESVAISPYKSAADRFTRAEPSEEVAAQTNWLLDSTYSTIVAGIASGRGQPEGWARALIDGAPHNSDDALAQRYVDMLASDETLDRYIGAEESLTWERAARVIPPILPRVGRDYIAVIAAEGMIVDGESESPPVDVPLPFVGGARIGDETVVQQVRRAMADPHARALVLYVDSGGGSATASEAMAAALEAFAATRPLVVAMGNVAASGGYYIATPAHWIVAQAGTITGSIGVIMARFLTEGLLRKLRFNPVGYMRGENAGILSASVPLSDDQRALLDKGIRHTYAQFTGRVARSRRMSREAVDGIGGGRVWTGQQALEHGLVDQLGGLHEALYAARRLAKLPEDTPGRLVPAKNRHLTAQMAAASNPAAGLRYITRGIDAMHGRTQMLMPVEWRWR
jgi:protease IV